MYNDTVMHFSICIEMIFPELPIEDRIERVAAAGFGGIEFWDWRDKPLDTIPSQCARLGLAVTCMSGHRAGSLLDPAEFDIYEGELIASIEAARRVSCSNLMLLTNPLGPEGEVLNSYPAIAEEQKLGNCLDGLSRLIPLTAEHTMRLLLEPLNTVIDHPGYWLDDADRAFEIIRSVGHPGIRLLYDLYHMRVMGRDVHKDLEGNLDTIGYIHAADIPGRHEPGAGEPGTGDMDYPSIFRLLESLGYDGTVGFEFSPAASSDDALRTIGLLTESFL